MPNNTFIIDLGDLESISIQFYAHRFGSSPASYDDICAGWITLNPPNQWALDSYTHTIKALRGSPCTANVTVSRSAAAPVAVGNVVRPNADLEIVKVARIGGKVFALVGNNGPDDLSRAGVILRPVLGSYCEKDDQFTEIRTLPDGAAMMEIGAPWSGWMYIHPDVDMWFGTPPKPGSVSACETAVHLRIIPGLYLEDGAHFDPNKDNNEKIFPLSAIKPMN